MKRLLVSFFLSTAFLQACSDGGEENVTAFALTDIEVRVDGVEIVGIPITGFDLQVEGAVFMYSESGPKEGQWTISDDGSSFSTTFGDEDFSFPIVTSSEEAYQLEMRKIDLTQGSFSQEEQQILLVANKNLLNDNQHLGTYLEGASELTLIFTITKS